MAGNARGNHFLQWGEIELFLCHQLRSDRGYTTACSNQVASADFKFNYDALALMIVIFAYLRLTFSNIARARVIYPSITNRDMYDMARNLK